MRWSNFARAWIAARSTGNSRRATSSFTPRNSAPSATTRSSSRSMPGGRCREPVAGLPRVDRAVSAMLLTAWVALKLGDRVALNAFDSRPRIASGLVSGAPAFAELQRLAARIDYSGEETNYTFALTTLAARLDAALDDRAVHRIHRSHLGRFPGPRRRAARRRRICCWSSCCATRSSRRSPTARRESADDVTRAVTAAALAPRSAAGADPAAASRRACHRKRI